MIISSFVWTKHRNETERRTDGQNPSAAAVCTVSYADAL